MTDYFDYIDEIEKPSDNELILNLSCGIKVQFNEEGISDLIGVVRDIEDERYGRWRDPEDTTVLVYDQDGELVVVDEAEASLVVLSEKSKWHPSIKRYAATQKPWHEAKPGEAWLLKTDDGEESVYIVDDDGDFDNLHFVYSSESKHITAGYRIWPTEGDDSE